MGQKKVQSTLGKAVIRDRFKGDRPQDGSTTLVSSSLFSHLKKKKKKKLSKETFSIRPS